MVELEQENVPWKKHSQSWVVVDELSVECLMFGVAVVLEVFVFDIVCNNILI